ncbi:hypothetical protein [Mycolicibacterium fallax]|uniref:Uncharacterized protein n=1 Tax=Mycolicibacterium fallax TaxID=1793 RepID=A0A1X1RJ17_MYCFA|nr:hypothetical protein [Mycolicibacterium fallax]ORV07540.1 hypothetical protein AWC04_03770 [Mycolicibacterium fallax]BBY99454.1 hypothetical protein MFAL_29210 [Mycolicibacterium fallax]
MALRSWIVGLVLGLVTAVVVVAIVSRRWVECDIGVNNAANSFTLLLFVAPVVFLVAAPVSGLGYWVIARWSTVAAYIGAVVLAVVVGGVAVWVNYNPGGDYPTPMCANSALGP